MKRSNTQRTNTEVKYIPAEEEAQGVIQILVPIYNEGKNVCVLYDRLLAENIHFDLLQFIYDLDEDITLPLIAKLRESDVRVQAIKNQFGPGILNALRWGFSHCFSGPIIVLMGDNSDKLAIVPEMIELWKKGATMVCPSRYMKGGKQHGGGLLKSSLSRVAGLSLKLLGFPTADPTNNFKLYDGTWLRQQNIESAGGFEVALELTYKAFCGGHSIVELPTVWQDRTQGQSRFRLMKWLPHYLRWYFKAVRSLAWRRLLK